MSNGELVRIPGKKHLSYYELIRNSAVYAFSDKVAILIFGIILIVLSNLENYILVSQDALLSKRILLVGIIVVVLTIFEAGYSFKIKEETLRGSKRPPLFNHFKEECKKKSIIEIKVTASFKNRNAIEFYIKNGFEESEITLKQKI